MEDEECLSQRILTIHEIETKLSLRISTMEKQILKFSGMLLNNLQMC